MNISKEFLMKKKSLRKEVKGLTEQMSGQELAAPTKPRSKIKSFPEILSDIDIAELGDYLGNYTAHLSWLEHLKCLKQQEMNVAVILLNKVAADIVKGLPGSKKTEIDFVLKGDTFYNSCTLEKLKIQNDILYLETSIERLRGYYSAISRELTSRKIQSEGGLDISRSEKEPEGESDGIFNTPYRRARKK